MDEEGFRRFADLDLAALRQFQHVIAQRAGRNGAPIARGTVRDHLKGLVYLHHFRAELGDGLSIRGTIDGASVHPREVVKEALARNTAALICCHCHPSGISSPSQADEHITRRLKEALQLVDIRLLDHFIVGETISSFAELGIL
jgi:hypothetical protein